MSAQEMINLCRPLLLPLIQACAFRGLASRRLGRCFLRFLGRFTILRHPIPYISLNWMAGF